MGFFNYFLSALFVCGTRLLMVLVKMSFYSGLQIFTHNFSYIQQCPQWAPEFQSFIFEHPKFEPISSVFPWFVLEITVFYSSILPYVNKNFNCNDKKPGAVLKTKLLPVNLKWFINFNLILGYYHNVTFTDHWGGISKTDSTFNTTIKNC